jgi:8-oxo-dGTP pyrophosphatase MutT (NUDIX family)
LKKTKKVSIAICLNDRDEVLMGKRNDSGKWTTPGGHCYVGEDPCAGMVREFKEETGLDALLVKMLCCCLVKGTLIYLFEVKVDPSQKIDTSKDPDKECGDWSYVDPIDVVKDLHIPLKDNLVMHHWINN